MRMRILFLSPRQAWPPVSGAKLRELYFARALAAECDLSYLYFSEPAAGDHPPPDFLHNPVGVAKPKAYTPGRIVAGVLGRWPLPVVNYTAESMMQAISSAVGTQAFDLIHLDAIQMAGYVPYLNSVLPGVPVVYDWHNIESELMERFASNNGFAPKGWYAHFTAKRLKQLERWILTTAHGHVVCSERERQQLLQANSGIRVEAIDNGVDTKFFEVTARTRAERNRIVFVGSMSYHANIEAALWFARDIWPHVRKVFPALRLTLVGSDPVPAVKELVSFPGIEVTGTVPDVRPFYAQAIAAIAPLRTGAGTRLKILEAMAAGVPVVSTPLGAEGLSVVPGSDLLISETPQEWTAAMGSLQDPDIWSQFSDAGRHLAVTRYDWGALGRQLCETYRNWLRSAEQASR